MKVFEALFVLLALAGLALLGAPYLERALLYFPDRVRVLPAAVGLVGVEEHVIPTPDGERLVAWYGRAEPGKPTILYFHGNAGSLVNRAERMAHHLSSGRGMLIMAYRGYAGSSGRPSEAANMADAMLAYEFLVRDGVAPRDIILYGESLGSGIAVRLAAEKEVAGVILDAPYTAIVDVAARAYPFLPVRLLMKDRYESMPFLPALKCPLLVLHGEQDRIVPVEMGRAVYAAAPGPKQLATFPGAGHSDHHLFGSYETVDAWIESLKR